MNIEKTIPFSWEDWDEQDVLLNTYYEVEFIDDFGIFNKGDKFSCINIHYGEGVVEAYNEAGTEIILTQKYKAIAI